MTTTDTVIQYIEAAGFTHKTHQPHGGEWHGPCPKCGGEDRVAFWPAHSSGKSRWWCRQCNTNEDFVGWLMLAKGMGFKDASEIAGTAKHDVYKEETAYVPRSSVNPTPPSFQWQARAAQFVSYCRAQAAVGNAYTNLMKSRGWNDALNTVALLTNHIGYNPETVFDKAEAWGIEGEPKRKIVIPQGVVIPNYFDGKQLWSVRIRRYPQDKFPKYHAVYGSVPALYIASLAESDYIFLCESEFDALAIRTVSVGKWTAVATGSTTWCRHGYWVNALRRIPGLVLPMFHGDDAGRQALAWWRREMPYGKMIEIQARLPDGCKDMNDIFSYYGRDALYNWLTELVG